MNDEPRQRQGLRALQICVGLMLLFRASTEWRFSGYLWGPHGIGVGSSGDFLILPLARVVDVVFAYDAGPLAIIILMGLGAIGLIFGKATRWSAAIALFSSQLLGARLPELGDGGDNIARLVLVYMLFALPNGTRFRDRSFAVWVHNVAVVAIGLQIMVMYLTSGFMKATGEKWGNGTALYAISQVEWFAHPLMRVLFGNPFLTTMACYGTVLFQLWFPLAVLSRFRVQWLIGGVVLHLGIAAMMGLVGFSTVMIGIELFFVADDEWARAGAWLNRRFGTAVRSGSVLSPDTAGETPGV